MSADDKLARLKAGIEADRRLAQAAEEFWESGFNLHYSEIEWEVGTEPFAHLRQQNPSHTLRVVDAHRKILDEHRRGRGGNCDVCREYDFRYDYNPVPWPCPTVRALADIYPAETGEVDAD